jgi:phage terminase large subunit GpA-like protein
MGVYPLKALKTQTEPFRWHNMDRMPNGDIIEGGLKRVTLDSKYFAWMLWRRLQIKRGDPGYWHLPRDCDDVYARHLTAESPVEVRDKAGRIHTEWKQHRQENHLGDCEKYSIASAKILSIGYDAKAPEAKPEPAAPPAPPPAATTSSAQTFAPVVPRGPHIAFPGAPGYQRR